jgi:hypothetical protein
MPSARSSSAMRLASGISAGPNFVPAVDKADYTIRMDVETGTFEQVLIEAGFDGGSGMSGSRVSGSRVGGHGDASD